MSRSGLEARAIMVTVETILTLLDGSEPDEAPKRVRTFASWAQHASMMLSMPSHSSSVSGQTSARLIRRLLSQVGRCSVQENSMVWFHSACQLDEPGQRSRSLQLSAPKQSQRVVRKAPGRGGGCPRLEGYSKLHLHNIVPPSSPTSVSGVAAVLPLEQLDLETI